MDNLDLVVVGFEVGQDGLSDRDIGGALFLHVSFFDGVEFGGNKQNKVWKVELS